MPLPQQLGQREIKGFSARPKKCPDYRMVSLCRPVALGIDDSIYTESSTQPQCPQSQ